MKSGIKPSVLIFVDWFYPGYLAGGPVQSIVSLVEQLQEEIDFWIVTRDRDLNSETAYPEITSNSWVNSIHGCKVFYASPDRLGKRLMHEILSKTLCKTIYINSLFSKHFSIIPLLLLKKEFRHFHVIVAPRGMFSRGALSLKRLKKKSFLFYSKYSGLHKSVTWHAASDQEKKEIERVLGQLASIRVIPNFPRKIQYKTKTLKVQGELKLFFSSRISRVKNLHFVLETLQLVKVAKIRCHIYGLIEDEIYWEKCQDSIQRLPENVRVEYKGTYKQEEAVKVFETEEVLFLPTLNENYGHSIVESLRCGCPVIISNRTPWNDLEQFGAGYALPLTNQAAFANAIEHYAAMTETEFDKARMQAIYYIEQKINLENTRRLYKELFHV